MTIYWGVVSSQPANVILPQTGNLALITSPSNLNPDGTLRFNPPLFTSYPRPGCAFDRSTYNPTSPDCVPGSAAIWQYAEACPPGINPPHGLYDMDLANDTGYATMWSG